ncbi:MAG TPA: NAD(P)/FAD-dependent oxidoreductase [Thermoprotei archaeon]|nr:NAD(P)/FAD-dependent oxidoreductase [Thermoprotei archaeon]
MISVIDILYHNGSIMKRVLVLGGGTGGTIVSNRLAYELSDMIKDGELIIEVVNPSEYHYYQPAFLLIPVNKMDERESYTYFQNLIAEGVKWIKDRAVKIDIDDRSVVLSNGDVKNYDYLVISTGAALDTSDVKGLEDTYHFYSLDAAVKLKNVLSGFDGGDIVIGVSSIPYRCPPAPAEMAFLLNDYFTERGLRDKVRITYFYPLPRVFPVPGVSDIVDELMDRRGIDKALMFNLDYVDTENKRIVSLEGEELRYDLAIVIPPHKGAQVIRDSGLGDEDGWVDVDRYTLNIPGYDDVYVIGDATNLPVSKAGSVADFEAAVVSRRIVDELMGYEPISRYDGKVMCFLVTGFGEATVLVFDYNNPPKPVPPSFIYYWLKLAYNKMYWSITAKSLLAGVVF